MPHSIYLFIYFSFQMTGRKGRVVSNNDGNVQYESRCEMDVPLEILNLTEKKRFMDGEKVCKKSPYLRNKTMLILYTGERH